MHPIDGEVAKIVARCCVVDISDVRCRFGSPQPLQCRGTTLTRDQLWWLSKPPTEHQNWHKYERLYCSKSLNLVLQLANT